MKNIVGSISKTSIKKLLLILIILAVTVGIYLYMHAFYVIIRFDELGPLTKNMSAYYSGFRIGKIVHIGPDKDFEHTLVKVNLNQRDINLPQNTTVHVKKFPNGELYLEFVYPDSPSFKKIQRGELLEGIAPYNLEEFMLGQNISSVSDLVSIHVIKALDAMDVANKEMELFFRTTSKILQSNDKAISESVNNAAAMTKSLAEMAENMNQVSQKLNQAVDKSTIKDTTENIKDSTSNLKDTTEMISVATKDIDKTMKKIDDTVAQVNATAENLNSMTSGLNETLSKRFAGMRIMFGTPVKRQNDPKSCAKSACE